MVDAVSAASPPTYTSILALDSQIRDFDVPIPLRMMDQDGDAPHPLALHQAMIACNREVGEFLFIVIPIFPSRSTHELDP